MSSHEDYFDFFLFLLLHLERNTVNTSTWETGLAPLDQAVSTNMVQLVTISVYVFSLHMIP